MAVQFYNEVEIARPSLQVFDYVTQPWLWCEWHPSSQSAHKAVDRLAVGDEFDEVIRLQPVNALPFYIRKATHYQVQISNAGKEWKVHGKMNGGELTIHYQFKPVADQPDKTLFCRTLTYDVKGIYKVAQFILNPKMQRLSGVAVSNLKAKLEQGY